MSRSALTLDDIREIEAEMVRVGYGRHAHLVLTREQIVELCASWRAERGLLRQPDVTDLRVLATVEARG